MPELSRRPIVLLVVVIAAMPILVAGARVVPQPTWGTAAHLRAASASTVGGRTVVTATGRIESDGPVRAAAPTPSPQAASPVLGTGWQGHAYLSASDQTPPDVQVASGQNYILESVNSHLDIYGRTGGLVTSYDLPTFFGAPSSYLTDPQLAYDAGSGRWFISISDVTTGQVLVAVSQTSSPLGSWTYYAAPGTPTYNCADQPLLAVGSLNVILSINWWTNLCTASNYTWLGAQVWIINKTDMTSGAASANAWVSAYNVNDFSIHPVKMETPSALQYMVSVYWPGTQLTSTLMQWFQVSGSPPGSVTVSETDFTMPLASLAPGAAEPGTADLLDPGDIRVADAAWSRGALWLAFEESCSSGGPTPTPCIRFMEIDATQAAVLQDFDLSSPTRAYFYPALALDAAGDLAVVFGYSSGSDYPGILATGRLAGDAAGTLQPPVLVKAGTGSETTWCYSGICRYGDFFGAGTDPLQPATLWLAGEFGQGTSGWGTYIFSAQVKAMLSVTVAVAGGTAPAVGPSIHFILNGVAASAPLGPTATTVLADPGSAWSVDANFTAASGLARYVAVASDVPKLTGTATVSMTETITYRAQYMVLVVPISPEAISLVQGGGWYDGGSAAHIAATGNANWLFVQWEGLGNGSYSGLDGTRNITVLGPIVEVAIFDPGLTIVAGPGGSVAYADGPVEGTVAEGANRTIFVPLGSNVTLTATPSSFVQAFSGWSGTTTASTASVTVSIVSPGTVTAGFSLNLAVVGGIPAAVIVAAVLVVFLIRRKKRKPAATPPPAAPAPRAAPPSAPPPNPPEPTLPEPSVPPPSPPQTPGPPPAP